MATLPDYTALGERPVPRGDGGVVSYDPTVGRGLQQAGQGIAQASGALGQASNILASMAERQDAIIGMDSATKLKQIALDLQHADKTGFSNIKSGGVLKDFEKTYRDKFDAAKSQIQDGLESESQKRTFNRYADMIGLQFNSSLLTHKAAETHVYNQQVRSDVIKTAFLAGASDPMNGDVFTANMMQIEMTVREAAADLNLGDRTEAYVALRTRELGTEMMKSRVNGALLQDSTGAAAAKLMNTPEARAYLTPNDKIELGNKIKSVDDGQSLRAGSEQAIQRAQGVAPFSGVAVDHHADWLKPIEPADAVKQIGMVKAPSKWDVDISNAAAQYNIDPQDLKLRLVRESSLNENTKDSPKGAIGIAQLMPSTAKSLGVDPKDPKQSIFAAAKIMASAGPDPHQQDIAYYGPASPGGANTKQYAANGDVLRYALKGEAPARPQVTEASLVGSEAAVIQHAKAIAEEKYPGDRVWADRQVADARSQLAQQVSAFRAKEYENYSGILDVSVGDTGVKSLAELNTKFPGMIGSYEALSPEKKHSLERLWHSNSTTIAETPENTNQFLTFMGRAKLEPLWFKEQNIGNVSKDWPQRFKNEVVGAYLAIDKNEAKGIQYTKILSDPLVKNKIASAGLIEPSKDKKTDAKADAEYYAWQGMMVQSIDNHVQATGLQPTPKEYGKMASDLLAKVKTPGFWRGTDWPNENKMRYQIKPGETFADSGGWKKEEQYTELRPAMPKTREEIAALPPGTWVIDPKTQMLTRRK